MVIRMKFAIIAGVAITCLLLAPAFAAPGGTYAQDGYSCWQSNARNCICSYAVSGPSEFNRESKNGTSIVEVFRGGRGFALSGNQFHVVKVVAKSKRIIDASKASMIRDLLRSNIGNKTFAELKKDALAIIGEPVYNGSLRFGQSNYALVNMKMASADNSSILEADLSPQVKGEASGGIAGHIKLTTSTHEGFRVSNGDLNLNGYDYEVFINMMPLHARGLYKKTAGTGARIIGSSGVDSGPMTG
jgi:hypothetical protein